MELFFSCALVVALTCDCYDSVADVYIILYRKCIIFAFLKNPYIFDHYLWNLRGAVINKRISSQGYADFFIGNIGSRNMELFFSCSFVVALACNCNDSVADVYIILYCICIVIIFRKTIVSVSDSYLGSFFQAVVDKYAASEQNAYLVVGKLLRNDGKARCSASRVVADTGYDNSRGSGINVILVFNLIIRAFYKNLGAVFQSHGRFYSVNVINV